LAERLPVKQHVVGSSPTPGANEPGTQAGVAGATSSAAPCRDVPRACLALLLLIAPPVPIPVGVYFAERVGVLRERLDERVP
jgi:hypothetical protein